MKTHSDTAPKHARWNSVFFAVDYISFMISMTFVSMGSVMPALVRRLTPSKPLVGMISTVFNACWLLPQLPTAHIINNSRRKKPVMAIGATSRIALAIIALSLFLGLPSQPSLMLVVFFVCLGLFAVGDGVASIAWFDLLAQTIPVRLRGRVISMSQVISGVAGIAVGSLVSLILEHEAIGFPTDFALLFSGASVMLVPSTVALMLLREPKTDADAEVDGPETGQTQDPDKPPKSLNWLGFLLRDAPFRQLLASRILVGMVSMSFPFYVGHAEDVLDLPQRVVGYFVIAQTLGGVLGSLALGPVSERQGPLRVARIGALAAMTGPLYALITHLTGNNTLTLMYPAVFAIYGIYNNAIMLGFTNYMLELPQEGMRAAYVGWSNTILGIMTLVPTLGGWLLDRTSYTVLFALTVGLASAGFLSTLRLRPAQEIRGCAQ